MRDNQHGAPSFIRYKAGRLLFIVAIICGTGFVAQGIIALNGVNVKFDLAV